MNDRIFQIVAVVILLLFYGCYFTKLANQKRKGIQTDQLGKGKEGFVKVIEITMKVATYIVPLVEVISVYFNITKFPNWVRLSGGIVGFVGVAFFMMAVITMSDSWRAGVSKTDKTEFVSSGIFQISRNPAFLGFDLVYIGILLMFFNWVLFIVSLIAIVMLHLQIVNVEEEFLLLTFGEEYIRYKKCVNRYLGRRKYQQK